MASSGQSRCQDMCPVLSYSAAKLSLDASEKCTGKIREMIQFWKWNSVRRHGPMNSSPEKSSENILFFARETVGGGILEKHVDLIYGHSVSDNFQR